MRLLSRHSFTLRLIGLGVVSRMRFKGSTEAPKTFVCVT
jgi:hypothetical protein